MPSTMVFGERHTLNLLLEEDSEHVLGPQGDKVSMPSGPPEPGQMCQLQIVFRSFCSSCEEVSSFWELNGVP